MAVNIAPQVDLNGSAPGTGTSINFTENDRPTPIAPAATVTDPDSPNFAGGTLTVRIAAGAGLNDRLQVLEGTFMISEQDILYRFTTDTSPFYQDRRIGTFTGGYDASTPLVITFTDQATPDLVQELTRSIAFANFSDAPQGGDRSITFTLTDGDGGTSPTASATVTLIAVDDPPTAVPDDVSTFENAVLTGNVLADNGHGADNDPDGSTLLVSEVNGQTADVGKAIRLESGALLTLNRDGTFSYDPNGAFDYLVGGTGGANTQAQDSFTYRLEGSDPVAVTVTVNGVYSPGQPVTGSAGDDFLTGTSNNDYFDARQGGVDAVNGLGGDDYIYFGGSFGSADGGTGFDVVALLGAYDLTFGPSTLVGVERLTLLSGTSFGAPDHVTYRITTNDGNVAAGETLQVLATGLLSDETLTFNGLAEKDGKFEIYSGAGNDALVGGQQKDILVGNDGNDSLFGMGGDDWIAGGAGADTLRGGFGSDTFAFRALSDSTARVFDAISDFEHSKDRIDLHEIDANQQAAGDQAFTFIGSDAFSHSAGELRAYQLQGSTWAVAGDVDGDGVADLYIQVNLAGQATSLVASDFVL